MCLCHSSVVPCAHPCTFTVAILSDAAAAAAAQLCLHFSCFCLSRFFSSSMFLCCCSCIRQVARQQQHVYIMYVQGWPAARRTQCMLQNGTIFRVCSGITVPAPHLFWEFFLRLFPCVSLSSSLYVSPSCMQFRSRRVSLPSLLHLHNCSLACLELAKLYGCRDLCWITSFAQIPAPCSLLSPLSARWWCQIRGEKQCLPARRPKTLTDQKTPFFDISLCLSFLAHLLTAVLVCKIVSLHIDISLFRSPANLRMVLSRNNLFLFLLLINYYFKDCVVFFFIDLNLSTLCLYSPLLSRGYSPFSTEVKTSV